MTRSITAGSATPGADEVGHKRCHALAEARPIGLANGGAHTQALGVDHGEERLALFDAIAGFVAELALANARPLAARERTGDRDPPGDRRAHRQQFAVCLQLCQRLLTTRERNNGLGVFEIALALLEFERLGELLQLELVLANAHHAALVFLRKRLFEEPALADLAEVEAALRALESAPRPLEDDLFGLFREVVLAVHLLELLQLFLLGPRDDRPCPACSASTRPRVARARPSRSGSDWPGPVDGHAWRHQVSA